MHFHFRQQGEALEQRSGGGAKIGRRRGMIVVMLAVIGGELNNSQAELL